MYLVDGETDLTCDDFLGGRLRIWQPRKGYRAGVDAVLLAAAVAAVSGDRVLDVGCGVGTAGLCLLARVADCHVTGLELQDFLHSLAQKNRKENAFELSYTPLLGDLLSPPGAIVQNSFDHVIFNPPYMPRGAAKPSDDPIKRLANHEVDAILSDWMKLAFNVLKSKGTMTLIHRADRLDEILTLLREHKAGEICICPLWPSAGEPASRTIIRARKSVSSPMALSAGFIMHCSDGSYRDAVHQALACGAPLKF